MSPKIVDKELKTREIAQAALVLFSQKGYETTNVGQLAEIAGIGKGTIYEYFQTKEDLFIASINEWIEQDLTQMIALVDENDDPVIKLFTFIEGSMELHQNEDSSKIRLFIEFIKHAVMEDGIIYKKRNLIKEMKNRWVMMVVDILLHGVSKGVFKPEIARDAEKIAVNLLAYLDGISIRGLITEDAMENVPHTEYYIEGFFKSILAEPDKFGIYIKNL
ncbi:MAG: TetR/AcrR family transcriptional regulator [Desulfobacterales bacterium]|jgi:AcrR family transcriptional regulator|nr:TetR/AcrR family transcriptional regulator [Desulfobacteraceae bacterium]MBT4365679.1 TetR/AcrR family transcriptional regulator [Desulfobacteraceae bacterium]MBT7086319.1 TetR/AcrR family transcriptional regulator [Desulfobacterales bacterium]MBT7696726.1 TetR/AcrR family transcriptional regulator [Desulfobacterales bacterium]